MLIECGHCGAPLDCESGQRIVKCSYCAKSNRIASTKTLQAVTPEAWAPPPTWTHTESSRVLHVTAGTAAAGTGASGCVGLSIVGVVLAILTGVLMPLLPLITGGTGAGDIFLLSRWDGTAPLRCAGNDTIRVEDVTAELPGQVAIVAEGNCTLTVVGSRIHAATAVRASGNAEVNFEGCTLELTATGAELMSNSDLALRNTTLVTPSTGVTLDGNSNLVVTDGRVEGGAGGVAVLSRNADYRTDGTAQIEGGVR